MIVLKILFWLAAFIVFYTFAGYGILLYVCVKIKERLRRPKEFPIVEEYPEVTLLIAAYNEEDYIEEKMRNCRQIDYPAGKLHFLWVTDGSTDATPRLLREYPENTVLHEDARRGKTAALNRAMEFVTTPFVVMTDANTALNPESIYRIVRRFDDPEVGCVAGEKKVLAEGGTAADTEGLYWKYESFLKSLDDRLSSAMGAAGELIAIRRSLWVPIPKGVLGDDMILSMGVLRKGYKIGYCKEAYASEKPSANLKEEWKRKVRLGACGWQETHMLRDLMNPFRYGVRAFQFVSHRVIRWILTPSCLILCLLLNAAIVCCGAGAFYAVLLGLQCLLYGAALVGRVQDKHGKKSLCYVPYYFVFANLSTFAGLRYYLTFNGNAAWEKAKRAAPLLALLLSLSSCMPSLDYPGSITYRVSASEDFLELFKVQITYRDKYNRDKEYTMNDTIWSTNLIQTEDYESSMSITLSAKDITGSNLSKERYTMAFNPEILFLDSPEAETTKAGTGAGDTDCFCFSVGSPDASVSVAPLKYNKHFAFCFSVDDSYVNGWSKLFALLNGWWIDDVEFFHKDVVPTTGYQCEYPLCITDGCGNDRRFTFGEAIWPTQRNLYNLDGVIKDRIRSTGNPYISWEELQIITDMGNAVYWHNIDTMTYDEHLAADIVEGFQTDYDKTLEKIGYPLKTLAQPDGNDIYLEAAQNSPLVYVSRATTHASEVDLKAGGSLYKKEIFGGDRSGTIASKLEELARQAASDNPTLVGYLVHRPTEDELDMFRQIYALYGKAGADNIWVTSYDELYEYMEMRSSLSISSTTDGGRTYFTVSVPRDEKFLYRDLSFVVTGADEAARRESDNLYGFSSAVQKDGTVLVNCTFSDRSCQLARKYISQYEEATDSDYKACAEYLISLLRDDLQQELKTLLEDVKEPTRENYPLNGEYTRNQIKKYLRLYDGYSLTLTEEE